MESLSRRSFLRGISAGVAAGAAGLTAGTHVSSAQSESPTANSTVFFKTGTDRRAMVHDALKPFADEVKHAIKGKQVIVKPNFVVNDVPLCATHPDAVRGVLDFLKPIYNWPVIIGESTISQSGTFVGYENYGYTTLPDEYNVRMVDLNKQTYSPRWIQDASGRPMKVNLIDALMNDDNYIISVTRLKTHDTVIATLTLKNIVMAAPMNHYGDVREKRFMHEGAPLGLHYNMFRVAQHTTPDLAILDGVEGMQGNGPVRGTPMEHGVVLAGTDFISVDRLGVELMKIPYEDVAYLQWCAAAGMGIDDLGRIHVEGPSIDPYRKTYALHDKIEWQRSWKTQTKT